MAQGFPISSIHADERFLLRKERGVYIKKKPTSS